MLVIPTICPKPRQSIVGTYQRHTMRDPIQERKAWLERAETIALRLQAYSEDERGGNWKPNFLCDNEKSC